MAQKKEYAASQKVLEAEAAVQEQKNKKPEQYQSAYESQLKQVMDRILNREDFRYNLDGDALYRQYRNQAVQNGRLAMADTMGKAAALTGGYGSSYAQSAGQQAYNRQLDTLADRIPELYNLAMNQYQLKNQLLEQKYNLLSGAERQEYGRYRDALAAWQQEADQLWQRYTDERAADYDTYRDEVADWKWQQEFDESRRRYDQQWEAEHPAVQNVPPVYTAPQTSGKKTTKTSNTSSAVASFTDKLRDLFSKLSALKKR